MGVTFPNSFSALERAKFNIKQIDPSNVEPPVTEARTSTTTVSTVHHHYYSDDTHWMGWTTGFPWCRRPIYYPHCYIVSPKCSSSKDDDNTALRLIAGLIFGGTTLFLSWTIGRSLAIYNLASREIVRLEERKNDVDEELSNRTDLLKKMERVFKKEMEILEHQQRDAAIDLAGKTAFLASTVLGFCGAVLGSSLAMTTALIGSLAAGSVLLFKGGFSMLDQSLPENIRQLEQSVQKAEQALRGV